MSNDEFRAEFWLGYLRMRLDMRNKQYQITIFEQGMKPIALFNYDFLMDLDLTVFRQILRDFDNSYCESIQAKQHVNFDKDLWYITTSIKTLL